MGWWGLHSIYHELWGEGIPRTRKRGSMEGVKKKKKRKYLADSYIAARANVHYKLSSFFPMLF